MQCAEGGVAIAWRRKIKRTLTPAGELLEDGIDVGFFGRDEEDARLNAETIYLDAGKRQLLTRKVHQTMRLREFGGQEDLGEIRH